MSSPNGREESLLQEVTVRATVDLEFRRRLLAEPERAILEVFGVALPPGHRIRFIEKPAGIDTLIVLPDPRKPGDKLDDEDLENVAGGTSCYENTTTW